MDKAHSVYDDWCAKGGREAEREKLAGVDPCLAEERFTKAHPVLTETLHDAHDFRDAVWDAGMVTKAPPRSAHPCPAPEPRQRKKRTSPSTSGHFHFETSPDGKGVIPMQTAAVAGAKKEETESRIPRVSVDVGWGAMQAESDLVRFYV